MIVKKTAAQLPQNNDQLKAFCILIVEDSGINQRVAKEFLEYNRAIVEIAYNGKVVIEILRHSNKHFDFVC